jgi:hypothetical protein
MTTGRDERDDLRGFRFVSALDAIDLLVLVVLAVAGWGLWAWADSRTDAEAWDHDSFWSIVLPVMALLSGVAGWLRPGVARLVGVALVVPQAVSLFATSGSGPLAVVGLLFFIVFALFFTGIALGAARLRNARSVAERP